ncbi:MAG TPA: GNAT family N-acetyltransferase [Thermoanaerobaculia bacterium]|jgi:ribosomal protein S18 acetylase RimI-like enzyme|nr:GNAT family N-acetyltransferase [Thermoanaerobaculia bacterium]
MAVPALTFRDEPRAADLARVREIVDATGFFSPQETAVAVELLDDRLAKGPASDYRFLLAEEDGRVAGYTAYGRIPFTRASWDLYWIAVDPATQGRGVGRALVAESERRMALAGPSRIYVETSSREQYAPTRGFYERCGYQIAATLEDFYAPGDGKVIFVKEVGAILSPGDATR